MPVKILLADKSITIQKVVEMLFSGRDYEVVCVSDGETALNEAARVVPDVVLVDVDLPRIDGYSLAARLKQTPQLTETPVILMMSRDDVYDGAKGKQSGILDNIAKPFESQELIGKVKKALAGAPRRAAEPGPPPIRPSAAPAPPAARTVAEPATPTRPVQPPAPAAPPKPKKETPADIFDIISEAPSPADLARTAAQSEEDTIYEVEPVVEEVEEPVSQEETKQLPIGAKAVEEMRVGLGLTQTELQPGVVTYESLNRDLEDDRQVTSRPKTPGAPPMRPAPAPVQATSLPEADMRKIAEEVMARMAKDIIAQIPPAQPQISPDSLLTMVAEEVTRKTKEALAAVPKQPMLSAGEARGIAEDVVAKAAKDIIAQIPPAQPQISPDSLLTMVAEEVTRKTKEALAAVPKQPMLSAGEVRGIAEDVVAKAAKDIIAQIPPAQPQISPESLLTMVAEEVTRKTKEALAAVPKQPTLSAGEARGIAEDVVAKAAKDIIAQIPPAQPQISPETLRVMIAEEVASKTPAVSEATPVVQPSALTASDMWSAAEDAVQKIAREYFAGQPSQQSPQISDETLRAMVEAKVSSLTKEALANLPAAGPSALSPSDMWSMADEAVGKIAREFFEKQPVTQNARQSDEQLRNMVKEVAAKTAEETFEKKATSLPTSIPMDELRKMAQETISRMSLELVSDMTPSLPKISEDTVRKGIEEAVVKIAREVALEVIEKVAWDTVPRLAEVLIKEEIERLKAEP